MLCLDCVWVAIDMRLRACLWRLAWCQGWGACQGCCQAPSAERCAGGLPPQDAAGQLRKSPHQFSGIGSQSPLLWLARGYAVLDGPTMPIVAEGEDEGAEPNDTYIAQLVASAGAAVEARTSLPPARISPAALSHHGQALEGGATVNF